MCDRDTPHSDRDSFEDIRKKAYRLTKCFKVTTSEKVEVLQHFCTLFFSRLFYVARHVTFKGNFEFLFAFSIERVVTLEPKLDK